MSAELKKTIQFVGVLVGIATGTVSSVGVYVITPYRVSALERQVESSKQDHDLLMRIDERLQDLQKRIKNQ